MGNISLNGSFTKALTILILPVNTMFHLVKASAVSQNT